VSEHGRRAVLLSVIGRVQGVGYRAFVERQARALGLSGFVRNRSDGSVEAHVEGSAGAVDELIAACRRGPAGAVVNEVQIVEHAGTLLAGFTVLPTR
jgi:acylphosphatase